MDRPSASTVGKHALNSLLTAALVLGAALASQILPGTQSTDASTDSVHALHQQLSDQDRRLSGVERSVEEIQRQISADSKDLARQLGELSARVAGYGETLQRIERGLEEMRSGGDR